jgi:hypothetical protein
MTNKSKNLAEYQFFNGMQALIITAKEMIR